ncbi:unnamed protein product [Lampetra planeri]
MPGAKGSKADKKTSDKTTASDPKKETAKGKDDKKHGGGTRGLWARRAHGRGQAAELAARNLKPPPVQIPVAGCLSWGGGVDSAPRHGNVEFPWLCGAVTERLPCQMAPGRQRDRASNVQRLVRLAVRVLVWRCGGGESRHC